MNKYLEIPTYYDDLAENIFSKNLQSLFYERELLTYLRNTYQNDISLFYNIRDELMLRGIAFKEEHQNNFLPSLQYPIQYIINIEEDGKKFNKIDEQITGLYAIKNRYKIDSDLFFKNMPIDGIAHFLKKDPTFLRKQFERVGFTIIPVGEYSAGDEITIRECFKGNEYLAFYRYCYENNKKFFSELTIDFIENFRHVKGIGPSKYMNVTNKFNELLKEVDDIKISKDNEKKGIIPIDYFVNNPLRNLLKKAEIDYLNFIDSIYFAKEETTIYRPIAEHIFEEKKTFIRNLEAELENEKNSKEIKKLQDSIKIHPNYELLMGLKSINLKRVLRLPELEEKDNNIHLFEMVEKTTNKIDLMVINSKIQKYKSPSLQIEIINEMFKERDRNILFERLDKTLQEVGDLFGVTRERVRQIEQKAQGKLQGKAEYLCLDIYFNFFLQDRISMSIEKFMEKLHIDLRYKEIFTVLVDSYKKLERKEEELINKEFYTYVTQMKNIINEQSEGVIQATEILEKFNKSSEFEFTVELTDYFMNEIGYKRKNSIYFKHNIKLPAQISYLFKFKLKKPIEITDENFEYLQQLMKDVFDDQFESGKRAAVERIRSTKNVILVDANTFMYYDLDAISQVLLNEIEKELEKELQKSPVVTAKMLYQKNSVKWKMYQIISHHHLYSILGYHFNDVYLIGKGNTLEIYKSKSAIVNRESLLINYIKKHGGKLSKKKILENFKWQSYKLEQILSNNKELITILEEDVDGYSVKLITAFNFKDVELQKIRKFVEDNIKDEYFFTADLLIEMEFDEELSEILARKKITDPYTFGSVLKWLDPDLRGFQHLLFKKNSEIDSIEKVLIIEFQNLVRRDEIENFLIVKGYASSTVFSIINLLLENNSFYVYTAYQYINANQIYFNNNVKDSLKQYLDKSFGNKMYLSALELRGYTSDILSVSRNSWQPQLITEFANQVGYRHIKTTPDYRYNKWVLVREELDVTNYEDLVHYVVMSEYKGNFHERDLAKFLEERKLTHSPYQLSLELKTSPYFEMRDLGFVKLKERLNGVK